MGFDHQVNEESLRIDFFRVVPECEPTVVNNLRKRLGPENVAIFQAFGHYDIIAVYSGYDEKSVLFKGGIDGIRSFSCVDCYQISTNPKSVIDRLTSKRLLSCSILSLSRDHLAKKGGIINSELIEILNDSSLHLLSLSWGEQVVIHSSNEMSNLWEISRNFINWAQGRVLDIHSVIAVNYDIIENNGDRVNVNWEEKIDKAVSIVWDIDLKCVEGSKSFLELKRIINSVSDELEGRVQILEIGRSFSMTNVSCKISGDSWNTIIKAIKKIRSNGSSLFNSTRLRILENY